MLTPLFLILQSATPYGSPLPQTIQPAAPVSKPARTNQSRFNNCINLAIDDTPGAIADANRWRIEGGGFLARHCLGFAYAQGLNWPAATTAFVQAAREAELAKYPRTADFWAQAGNAALAGGQAEKALEYLGSALVQGTLTGMAKGEAHLDRARAHVALNNYEAAKAEFIFVHELAPQDPLGWLLSATLARRMNDLPRAKSDIAVAEKLVKADPAIALEAGNIAYAAGDNEGAIGFWKQAVELDPESPPAGAAARRISRLDPEAVPASAKPAVTIRIAPDAGQAPKN